MFGHERRGRRGITDRWNRTEPARCSPRSLSAQGKLLRLLEDRSYRRLGGAREMVSNARIVSSSNADLSAFITEGRFRADLYYRLNVIELHIPPLRARREDIIPWVEHFLGRSRA
jgi:transcriptional regulator with PAS, ATPase and Fis domain